MRGREHWEVAVIKLGTQMQTWASWLGALNWGMLWTQRNIQGPLTHPTVMALWLDAYDWLVCLKLQRVKYFSSSSPRSKGNFHSIVTCKCQDCNLKLYFCLCWEVQRVFSYTSPLSFPRHDIRIKSCLANGLCHAPACKVHSQQQRWCAVENSSDTPAHSHLSGKVWEIFNTYTCTHNTALMRNVRRQLLLTWSCQLL